MSNRQRGFSHPLWDKIHVKTDDEIKEIFRKYKAGDETVKDELIFSLLGNGMYIVGKFLSHWPIRYKDELVSAAMEGICYGVEKAKTLKHDNIGGYVTCYIHQYISKQLKKFPSIDTNINLNNVTKGESNVKEVLETLYAVLQNDLEREIVDYRLSGLEYDTICDLVGLSRTSIFLIRKDIEKRFCDEYMG